jgi:UDP-glucose 4-epimerase
MDVLIVGGCGFLGTNVALHFSALGHQVSLLDAREWRGGTSVTPIQHYRVPWDDIHALKRVLSSMPYAVVIHLGFRGMPEMASATSLADAEASINGSLSIIDVCAQQNIRRFLFASSGGTIYGFTGPGPILESEPCNPVSPYGRAKLAIEEHLVVTHSRCGLSYAALRIGNAYGPLQDTDRTQGIVAILAKRMIYNLPVSVRGDGSMRRDFIYIDDVARAFAAASQGDVNGAYNVGSGIGTRISDLIRLMEIRLNTQAVVHRISHRDIDVPENVLNSDRMFTDFGWSTAVPLSEGISRTLTWIQTACAVVPGPVPIQVLRE